MIRLVVEGQTTVVCTFDPEADRELPVQLAIGDGSPAQVASGTGFAAARKVDNVTSSKQFFPGMSEMRRKPMFRINLAPRSTEPLAFAEPDWENLDPDRARRAAGRRPRRVPAAGVRLAGQDQPQQRSPV